MKSYLFKSSCAAILFLAACNTSPDPAKQDPHPPSPVIDTCTTINYKDPIITHGFSYADIDTITLKAFRKGSNFSEITDSFTFRQREYIVVDSIRMERDLSSPKPLSTAYDWQICFSNGMRFNITDIKVGMEGHYVQGQGPVYWCELVSYSVNGKQEKHGNLFIKNPLFVYRWK